MTNKIVWGTDVGDILTAIENAQSAITDALDELRGIGELMDVFGMIKDAEDELEVLKDKHETELAIREQAHKTDLAREYYMGLL